MVGRMSLIALKALLPRQHVTPSPSESARNLKFSSCPTTDELGDGLSTAMPAGMKRQAAPSIPAKTCPHVLLLPKFVAPAAVCDAAGMLAEI